MTAGAYGAVQSSTYNTRALVPEVLVKDDQYAVVRPRIEVEELIAMDRTAPWAVIFPFSPCGRRWHRRPPVAALSKTPMLRIGYGAG
jgi:hypothetical protein